MSNWLIRESVDVAQASKYFAGCIICIFLVGCCRYPVLVRYHEYSPGMVLLESGRLEIYMSPTNWESGMIQNTGKPYHVTIEFGSEDEPGQLIEIRATDIVLANGKRWDVDFLKKMKTTREPRGKFRAWASLPFWMTDKVWLTDKERGEVFDLQNQPVTFNGTVDYRTKKKDFSVTLQPKQKRTEVQSRPMWPCKLD